MQKSIPRTLGIAFFLFLFSFNIALAQEAIVTDVDPSDTMLFNDLEDDEEVTADDLEINRPNILPDSPWYGIKKLFEGAQEMFTWNPVKKAQLQIDRANERLLEAQILAEESGSTEKLDEAIERYQARIEKVEARIEKLAEKHGDKIDGLLDKFTEHQLRHQKIFEKIEELTPGQKEKISIAKNKALEKLGEALSQVDNEKAEKRISGAMERVEGSNLKNFKNLEILKELADKVPEQAKEAIERAMENTFKRLGEDLEDIPEDERQSRLKEYIENLRGDSVKHLEILNELEEKTEIPQEVRLRLREIQSQSIQRIGDRLDVGNKMEISDIKERLEEHPELRPLIRRADRDIINRIDRAEIIEEDEDDGDDDDKLIEVEFEGEDRDEDERFDS